MAITKFRNGDVFRVDRDYDVVHSLFGFDDPDPTWREEDAEGHVHQWYFDGRTGVQHNQGLQATTPTLVFKKTGEDYWHEDDEPHDVGHLVCVLCGAGPITPGYTRSYGPRHIHGLSHYSINGESVSFAEFESRHSIAAAASEHTRPKRKGRKR